ncbi:MAG TPA: tryptophan synthase subunit alpha [Thermomicrobiales bacterium]|nr:tryptophan synthase subunit alpha [Thermomicrobiales bacterium]
MPSAASTGPSPIAEAFARAKGEGRIAMMPFVTGGYPTMAMTEQLIAAIVRGGADLIEVGIPFSDPIADGPTVQHTSQIALANGATLAGCLDLARRVRTEGITVPLVFMGYTNPFFQYGLDRLAAEAANAGVNGFIVPDLPIEESDDWRETFQRHGLDLIYLIAPTSTDARIAQVAKRARGFIYCVSLTGVTGAREKLADQLTSYINRIRAKTDVPLAIGFGVSSPEHVAEISKIADGAIVASALINHIDQFPPAEQPAEAEKFVRWLAGNGAL